MSNVPATTSTRLRILLGNATKLCPWPVHACPHALKGLPCNAPSTPAGSQHGSEARVIAALSLQDALGGLPAGRGWDGPLLQQLQKAWLSGAKRHGSSKAVSTPEFCFTGQDVHHVRKWQSMLVCKEMHTNGLIT